MTYVSVTGPRRGGTAAWLAIRRAFSRFGVRARRIVPGKVSRIGRALVIAGGKHVHPSLFDEHPIHRGALYDPPRDVLEVAAFKSMSERGGRTLGICRGLQLAVVARGGTLHQNVWEATGRKPPRRTMFARREIRIAPDSKLYELVGADAMRVNCLHSQGIRKLPVGWRAVAWDRDDIIQAVEGPGFLGVQWHPEYLPRMAAHQRLFHWVARGLHTPTVRDTPASC